MHLNVKIVLYCTEKNLYNGVVSSTVAKDSILT